MAAKGVGGGGFEWIHKGYSKDLFLLMSYAALDYDFYFIYFKFTCAFFYLMFLMDVLLQLKK